MSGKVNKTNSNKSEKHKKQISNDLVNSDIFKIMLYYILFQLVFNTHRDNKMKKSIINEDFDIFSFARNQFSAIIFQ